MRIPFRVIIPAAVVATLIGGAALAPAGALDRSRPSQNLTPMQAESIDLGYVNGIAYYTPEAEGFHVVATLSVGGGAPLQVAATLQPEQSLTVSVPGPEGGLGKQVEIFRRGDTITVGRPARLVLN
ncbi:hypothetical protein [Ancylobacter terrae]|uniref:hypothetical protein n=1 Tax=Ancylobacter sp. sgz301288 TaxID=3342077 RepID=UPI00385BB427